MTLVNNAVNVTRGGYIESTHRAHIAVVNKKGELLYSYGDPFRQTFARSSMKPFQAVPLIETGAAEHYSFDQADIALSCASHSGEPFHRSGVFSILERIGEPEESLQCGMHIPRDIDSYNKLIREGGELSPVFSNCSGKHSGMLTTAVHMGEDVSQYREIDHPVQQRILAAISDICDIPKKDIGLGVDGCGVPVHQVPLNKVALGFAHLAQPNQLENEVRMETLNTIREAMMTHPEMVAGTHRFDTDLMTAFNGKIVSKAGAEAVQCIGVVDLGIGIVVKIEDGSDRARSVVMMEILKQLGIGNDKIYQKLQSHSEPTLKNMRGDVIGGLQADFKLVKES